MIATIERTPIDALAYAALVVDEAAGASATIAGQRRNPRGAREVRSVDYSAHPKGESMLSQIAAEVASKHHGVRGIALGHRVSRLGIDATALYAAVSADHRDQAFTTSSEQVDAVKRDLPVRKLQYFRDGASEWVDAS